MFKKNMPLIMVLLCCAIVSIQTNVKADDTYSSLYEAIKAETATSYTMSADETATQNYGAMNAINLTITGNGHSVSGNNTYSGIRIDLGKELTINNIGSVVTESGTTTYSGFQNFRENTGAAIENSGTMSVAGGTNTGILHCSGTLEIKAGENLDNKGIIAQQEITNNGSVSTDSTKFFAESGTITNNGTLTYNAGQNTVNDITGSENGNVILNTNGDFYLNNKISGTQWSLNSGTLYFGDNADVTSAAAFNANGGTINVQDGKIGSRDLGNVNLNGKTNLAMDFRLNDLSTDKFNAAITNNGGKFNVSALHVTGTTQKDHFKVYLGDTTTLGRDNVSSDTFNLPTIMTPIRRIAGRVQDGYVAYAPTGNGWKDFNPAVLPAPVAAQLGGYLTMLNAYDEGFRNLDMKMLMTQKERQAYKMANKYASAEIPQVFSPTYLPEKESAGWFRPYSTFERVNLRGGPKVSNILYGSFFGGDSQMYELKNGWDFQWSLYAGYTGSHQAFLGNDIYQNGGILGVTGVWYKGNFFTAVTVNAGSSVAETSTLFGSEDFPMLMAGVASKTGYNWELAKGKFIIQPYYMMSYTFVKTFNYHNAAGVHITTDPLHAINFAPGIKFIGNLKNGWQPYFNIQMVWNVLDDTKFRAANISLPEMSIKPYVQYGVGLQRRWGERFTGYVQAMIRNGGRNGVALSAGFRWAVGKNYPKNPFKGADKTKVMKQ